MEEKAVVDKFDERIKQLDNMLQANRVGFNMNIGIVTAALTNHVEGYNFHEGIKEVTKSSDELDVLQREKFETEIRKLQFIVDCSRH